MTPINIGDRIVAVPVDWQESRTVVAVTSDRVHYDLMRYNNPRTSRHSLRLEVLAGLIQDHNWYIERRYPPHLGLPLGA